MDPVLNKKSLMIGVPGLVLQIGGNVALRMPAESSEPSALLLYGGLAVTLVGTVLLIWGLGLYAKSKGWSGVLGLLGLCSCIGLIILAVLPDKLK